MNLVFEAPIADTAKLIAMLEADPYAKTSFSRNGYKVKDGAVVGQDKEKIYAYLRASDEFASFAKEKLAGIAVESKHDVASAIAKKIEDEESNAEVGFGAIFG